MEKTKGIQKGSVPIENGNTVTWLSNAKADSSVVFDSGTWTVYLNTTDLTGTCTVTIGESDGTNNGFAAFTDGSKSGIAASGKPLTITITTGGTVPSGHYLALQITNSGTGSVTTDDSSYVTAPGSTPSFPLPELSAGILLVSGLAGMAGFLLIRRGKTARRNSLI